MGSDLRPYFKATLRFPPTVNPREAQEILAQMQITSNARMLDKSNPDLGFEVYTSEIDLVFRYGLGILNEYAIEVCSSEYVYRIPRLMRKTAIPDAQGHVFAEIAILRNKARIHVCKAAIATRPMLGIHADTVEIWQMARLRALATSVPGMILRRSS